jgi:hypothetical protein
MRLPVNKFAELDFASCLANQFTFAIYRSANNFASYQLGSINS